MGNMRWVVFLAIGVVLTVLPVLAFGSQLVLLPIEPVLHSQLTASPSDWDSTNRFNLDFNSLGETTAIEPRKIGLNINNGRSQELSISEDLNNFSSKAGTTDTTPFRIQLNAKDNHSFLIEDQIPYYTILEMRPFTNTRKAGFDNFTEAHDWGVEKIFSGKFRFPSDTRRLTTEVADTWGPVPLPIALLFFGSGIIGILSVRRTQDNSNVS